MLIEFYTEGLLNEIVGLNESATFDETSQLAAILSHELSHIILAHYLETRASKKLFELFETVFTDCAAFVLS